MRDFLKRLGPFAAVFLVIQTVVRLALAGREWGDIDHLALLGGLALGFVYDVAVFFYMAIFPLLLWWLMPARLKGTKKDRVLTTVLFTLMVFGWSFGAAAEWVFWDEFGTRFNFIAVDYLVYTTEVIGNIRESYPMPLILTSLALLTAFIVWLIRPWETAQPSSRRFRGRTGVVALFAILALFSYKVVKAEYSDHFSNAYNQEVARNGVFSLWHAFWHNELDYNKFYLTDAGTARPETIAHAVDNPGEEITPNVIFVTMESMSARYMQHFGNDKNLTPNMDALIDQSLFFDQLYATGTRTVRGLEALTLSIPPSAGNSIVRRPENDNLFTIGHLFREKGYDTAFVYGGFGYFDNMNAFYAGNGYRVVDRNVMDPKNVEFANVWGVDDASLYRQALAEADKSYAEGKKFFQMVMTTSNHRPYTYPEGRIDLPSKTSGRNGGVKYADYAVGWLIEEARKKPWFNNTIFVFVADHCASSSGKEELNVEKYHIPAIIYAPGIVKPQKVEQMISQIDLLPTLLGIMNWDYNSRFIGRDALREDIGRAFISNYQRLGYLTKDGRLTILEPGKQSQQSINGEKVEKPDPAHVTTAVRFYQSASDWKKYLKLTQ
jgi:phosphoglycerol transferase MdoB-like AlkP superfamily enzyme